MATWTVSSARAALPEILDRVEAGQEVTLTRHGRVVAVIVRPDILRARRDDRAFDRAVALRTRIDDARLQSKPSASISRTRAEELVDDIRAGRDARRTMSPNTTPEHHAPGTAS